MKLIIYCDSCGVLLPNAEKRGACCTTCQIAPRNRMRKGLSLSFSRRPSPERILAEIRQSVMAR